MRSPFLRHTPRELPRQSLQELLRRFHRQRALPRRLRRFLLHGTRALCPRRRFRAHGPRRPLLRRPRHSLQITPTLRPPGCPCPSLPRGLHTTLPPRPQLLLPKLLSRSQRLRLLRGLLLSHRRPPPMRPLMCPPRYQCLCLQLTQRSCRHLPPLPGLRLIRRLHPRALHRTSHSLSLPPSLRSLLPGYLYLNPPRIPRRCLLMRLRTRLRTGRPIPLPLHLRTCPRWRPRTPLRCCRRRRLQLLPRVIPASCRASHQLLSPRTSRHTSPRSSQSLCRRRRQLRAPLHSHR